MSKNKLNVMVDIETLSRRKNAGILSIGACKFDENEIVDKFYVNVDPQTLRGLNFDICPETVAWWKTQSKEARDALRVDQRPIRTALEMLSEWFGPVSLPTWANAPTFDCVILESAYQTFNIEKPWKYYDERCYRTISELFGIHDIKNREGSLHNALDDAMNQTKNLQSLFRKQ